MTATILREENIEYSIMQKIEEGLPTYGLILTPEPNATVRVREAFPTPEERQEELTITTVAFGFNVDDGGKPAELGSNLTKYVHTMEVWIFATEARFGRHVAQAVKELARSGDASFPLLDFNEEGNPQIDTLLIPTQRGVKVQHQANSSERPWDRYVWTTTIQVEDYYTP